MKTALVLLNYNDPDAALRAVKRAEKISAIDKIFVVDNASTDGSAEKLSKESGFVLVLNEKNGGYGFGNNRGIEKCAQEGFDKAIIANPDTVFSQEAVIMLLDALNKENTAAAGAVMTGRAAQESAFPLLSFWDELMFSGPVLKRIFKSRVSYPDAFFEKLPAFCGAVHGSFFAVNTKDFLLAGGFDERFFLFCEEKVLGQRIKAAGKNIVLTGACYAHEGSASMKNTGMDLYRRETERQKSERLYYKYYLAAGPVKMCAVRIIQAIVGLETRLYCLWNRS